MADNMNVFFIILVLSNRSVMQWGFSRVRRNTSGELPLTERGTK